MRHQNRFLIFLSPLFLSISCVCVGNENDFVSLQTGELELGLSSNIRLDESEDRESDFSPRIYMYSRSDAYEVPFLNPNRKDCESNGNCKSAPTMEIEFIGEKGLNNETANLVGIASNFYYSLNPHVSGLYDRYTNNAITFGASLNAYGIDNDGNSDARWESRPRIFSRFDRVVNLKAFCNNSTNEATRVVSFSGEAGWGNNWSNESEFEHKTFYLNFDTICQNLDNSRVRHELSFFAQYVNEYGYDNQRNNGDSWLAEVRFSKRIFSGGNSTGFALELAAGFEDPITGDSGFYLTPAIVFRLPTDIKDTGFSFGGNNRYSRRGVDTRP